MKNHWLLAVMVALVFGGCAGLRQFPNVSQDYDKALGELDAEYQKALAQIYGPPSLTPDEQRLIRNKLIETRMAVVDTHFNEFQAGLVKENVRVEFGIALLGIGVGAAGALAAETTSQILSAVSGGLAGTQAAYGKSVMYDKTMSALLAQMQAGRKVIAVRIFENSKLDIASYPLWLARTDLDAYYFAGSLPGAILGTAADAQVKQAQAEVRLRPITPGSASPEMFLRRSALGTAIDGLAAAKAKALVPKIATMFPEIKPFIDAQYPPDTLAADTTGSNAKIVLNRAVVLTVRTEQDAEKWQSAIGGL